MQQSDEIRCPLGKIAFLEMGYSPRYEYPNDLGMRKHGQMPRRSARMQARAHLRRARPSFEVSSRKRSSRLRYLIWSLSLNRSAFASFRLWKKPSSYASARHSVGTYAAAQAVAASSRLV